MGFLVVVGVLQFVYCVLVGNYVSLLVSLCFGFVYIMGEGYAIRLYVGGEKMRECQPT